MGKLKSVVLKMEHEQCLSLDENGFVIGNYYDLNGQEDPECKHVHISYAEFKEEILDCVIIPKLGEDSIANNTFRMPNNADTQAVLEEVNKLKRFAEELEEAIKNSIED